jgi:hypothetical protein
VQTAVQKPIITANNGAGGREGGATCQKNSSRRISTAQALPPPGTSATEGGPEEGLVLDGGHASPVPSRACAVP